MAKKTEKKISIIMPAYNAADTIKDSIESVFRQSYNNWELIIIDDCSRDNTVNIVESIIRSNMEYDIRLVKNEKNMGVAYSRNHGIEESNGEWIAFLDSDDMWGQKKLEKQINYINEHSIKEGLLFTGSSYMTNDTKKLDYVLRVPEKIDRKELLKQNLISCSSVLVSERLIKKYKFPEEINTIHEDFVVWLGILDEKDCAYGIDEPLLIYRITADSKSGRKYKAALMNWNTYGYVGLGIGQKLFYMFLYTLKGIAKWSKIKLSGM